MPGPFVFPPALTNGLFGGDPYTPLLRAYENDDVQVRVIAGAHVQPHSMYFNGVKWKFQPGTLNGQPVPVYYNLTVTFRIQ